MICKVQDTKCQHIRCSLVTWNSKFNTVMPFKGFTFRVARIKKTEKTLPNRPAKRAHGSTMGNNASKKFLFGQNRLSVRPYAFRNRVSGCEMTHSLARSPSCELSKGFPLISVTWLFRGLSCRTYWGNVFFNVICWIVIGSGQQEKYCVSGLVMNICFDVRFLTLVELYAHATNTRFCDILGHRSHFNGFSTVFESPH